MIKLGIIGTNFVSDWLCDSAKQVDGIECTAVYSRTREKGSEFAAKHKIGAVYTDMDEFLSVVDAVYIASPNALHFEQAKKALEMGVHVLVEKPATTTEEEYRTLARISRDSGAVILEAIRPVHDPALETVRRLIEEIKPIRQVTLEFCQYSSRYDRFKAGEKMNAFTPALGNAALMDIGVYPMECAAALFGETRVAYSRSSKLENGFEACGHAVLDYGEFAADVVYSKVSDSVNPSVIIGEGGAVIIGKLSTLESVGIKRRDGEYEAVIENRPENNMIYEIAVFRDLIRGELDPIPYHENTLASLAMMDETRRQNNIEFK